MKQPYEIVVNIFNSKTHLIDYTTTERFLDQLGGKEVDFVRIAHLKKYKNIDGFFIHTIEDGYKDNFLESRYITISAKFNTSISDTVFEVPQN